MRQRCSRGSHGGRRGRLQRPRLRAPEVGAPAASVGGRGSCASAVSALRMLASGRIAAPAAGQAGPSSAAAPVSRRSTLSTECSRLKVAQTSRCCGQYARWHAWLQCQWLGKKERGARGERVISVWLRICVA